MWTFLDRLSIVMGLISSTSIVVAVIHFFKNRAAEMRRQRARNDGRAHIPAILEITMGIGGNIEGDIASFINCNEELKQAFGIERADQLPKDHYFSIRMDRDLDFSMSGDLNAFDDELNTVYKKIKASGVDHIHFFFRGPSALCVKVGAKFSNNCTLFLYQYQGNKAASSQKYYYVGPAE